MRLATSFVLVFLFLLRAAFAQGPEKALEEYTNKYPQEKVVLLLSKPDYLAGETIFLKAYVLNGYEPSVISTNLYTELYDKDKNLLDKQIIPLVKGSGEGSFSLPASLAEEVYYIRAYTHWMLNFDAAFQCIKAVPVYNPYSSQTLRPKPVQWTARAFAESGSLVEGAVANVAVRLYTEGTLPPAWTGTLWEKGSNTAIANVNVYNNEIGQVQFVPEKAKEYKIVVKDASGQVQEISLPAVATDGIVLHTIITEDKLHYTLLFKNIPSGGKGYKLMGAMTGLPAFTASIARANGFVRGSIDIKNLPAGVLQLTLFDENANPVAERLCFLHQQSLQTTDAAVLTDSLSFSPKGCNHWQFIPDSLSWESYAVQVTDASFPVKDGFPGALYLTSDFPLSFADADWYFNNTTSNSAEALDALLITEKWTRYRWSDVLQNRFPVLRFQPEGYLSFIGTVKKGKKPQPFRDLNLVLQTADSSLAFLQVRTDSTGSFALQNLVFTDSLKIFYQPNKQKFLEGFVDISFETLNRFHPFTGTWPANNWTVARRTSTDTLPTLIKRAMAQRSHELLLAEKTNMLETVTVRTTKQNLTQELEKQLTSGLFSAGNAITFDFVNDEHTGVSAYTNIIEWLQGRVPGLSLAYRNGNLVAMIRNESVQFYLDEIPVDEDLVRTIAPFDIALLKVFRSASGLMGGNAIAIYTRRGGMPTKYKAPTLQWNSLAGYKKLTAFPQPNYSNESNNEVNDERVVLYRDGSTAPDPETKKVPVIFYNNNSAKRFHLLITGFTHEGKPVYVNRIISAPGT